MKTRSWSIWMLLVSGHATRQFAKDSLCVFADPEISAVSHLQNFANSVVIPYLPQLYSRKPVLDLPGTSARPTE